MPLVIFIPNWGRGNLIRKYLRQFKTGLSPDKYKIVIGNDGIEENFDDLVEQNIFYFTIHRGSEPRNGCFIRNYVIRNARCKNLFQKDPETELSPSNDYDWIKAYTEDLPGLIRPGKTLDDVSDRMLLSEIPGRSYRYHWGYVIPRQKLVDFGGYDEDYTLYGYEDTDLYYRLFYNEYPIIMDDKLIAVHHYHDIATSVYEDVAKMKEIFENKNLYEFVRNQGKDWGRG